MRLATTSTISFLASKKGMLTITMLLDLASVSSKSNILIFLIGGAVLLPIDKALSKVPCWFICCCVDNLRLLCKAGATELLFCFSTAGKPFLVALFITVPSAIILNLLSADLPLPNIIVAGFIPPPFLITFKLKYLPQTLSVSCQKSGICSL